MHFHHFCLRYHILMFSSTCVKNSSFNGNQRWTTLKTQYLRPIKMSAHNSAHSKLILDKTTLFSADFFNSRQPWVRETQSWSGLKQRSSALIFFILSEWALKNLKPLKQRCSWSLSLQHQPVILFLHIFGTFLDKKISLFSAEKLHNWGVKDIFKE